MEGAAEIERMGQGVGARLHLVMVKLDLIWLYYEMVNCWFRKILVK